VTPRGLLLLRVFLPGATFVCYVLGELTDGFPPLFSQFVYASLCSASGWLIALSAERISMSCDGCIGCGTDAFGAATNETKKS
jgi:hypothetical protein